MPETESRSQMMDGQRIEQELASRTFRIHNKRFYLDVKQNRRGRFVKITEAGTGGQKSRVIMSVAVAVEILEKINAMIEICNQLAPHNPQNLAQDGKLSSDTIVHESRRYYLDLKENERGRFLRLAMLSMGVRDQIAVPAQGLTELANYLADITEEFASDAANDNSSDLPEPKVLFVGNKKFYFDVGSNRYGVYLRISEVRANVRSFLTIPEQYCKHFCNIINELAQLTSSDNKSPNRPLVNGDNEADSSIEIVNEKPSAMEELPAANESAAVA